MSGRDRRVLGDHLGHHATQCFNTKGQRRHVEQQHIFTIARQHRALDRSTCCNRFIWVDVLTWFATKELFDLFLHLRHTGHTTDQNHVVDFTDLHACIFNRDAARIHGASDQLFDQGFELGTRHLEVQVLGARRIGSDVRQIDFSLLA